MSKYAEISLSVDAVVFGYNSSLGLCILLIKRKKKPFKGLWAIPGGFVEQEEPLEKAVLRELKEETGVQLKSMEQLYTFGEPGRDPRGRTVSVAFYTLVNPSRHKVLAGDDAKEAHWFSLKELPKLAFDHRKILDYAVSQLREKADSPLFGADVLEKNFTITDLRLLHETLLDRKSDRRNFEKKVMKTECLKEVAGKARNNGRPAKRFRIRKNKYSELQRGG